MKPHYVAHCTACNNMTCTIYVKMIIT